MSTPSTGRRIATRQRRRPDRAAVTGGALVAVSALLLVASGVVSAEPEPTAAPTAVPVDQVTNVCVGPPASAQSQAYTLAAPLPEAQDGGKVSAGPVGEPPREETGAGRGQLTDLKAPAAGSALTVAAEGAAAVGRATFQVDRGADAGALGLQECLAPRARWWFTGAGAGLDHQSRLVLANVDPGPAVLDVVVHGPQGTVDSVGTRGITLAPGEVRTIDLLDVAPKTDELAVHVETSRGRVVAAVADSLTSAPGAAAGREWIPAQPGVSRVVRLAPLPRQADRRTLVVANPRGREALVGLEVSGESGSFAPAGVPDLRVPPGTVVTADLGSAVGKDASAVLLHSTVPVSATVRSSSAGDLTYAAPAPLLDGPAAALLPQGTTGALHLTAGEHGGTAKVTAYSDRGDEVGSKQLDVAPGATLAWQPKGKAAYLVLTPTGGRLFGGVTLAGQGSLAQVPLRPLPVALRRPLVTPVVH